MTNPLTDEKLEAAREIARKAATARTGKSPITPGEYAVDMPDGRFLCVGIAELVAEIDRLREQETVWHDLDIEKQRQDEEREAALATAKREAEETERVLRRQVERWQHAAHGGCSADESGKLLCKPATPGDFARAVNQLSAAREATGKVPHLEWADARGPAHGKCLVNVTHHEGETSPPFHFRVLSDECARLGGACALAALRESKEGANG